jgi:hypothetical protein
MTSRQASHPAPSQETQAANRHSADEKNSAGIQDCDGPTMIESGLPNFLSDTFQALFAPAGTVLMAPVRALAQTPASNAVESAFTAAAMPYEDMVDTRGGTTSSDDPPARGVDRQSGTPASRIVQL